MAGATTVVEATQVLADYLPRFNAQVGVPAANPTTAYRPLPAAMDLRQICCFMQRRVVANDDTVQIDGQRLQLLPGRERQTYVRATVEVRTHLDGTISTWYQDQEIRCRPAPPAARAVRQRTSTAVGVAAGGANPAARAADQTLSQTEREPSLVPAALPPADARFTDQLG